MSRHPLPKRSLRDWCDHLASWLETPQGLASCRRLQHRLRSNGLPATPPVREFRGARNISIWRPVGAGGELAFERPATGPFGDHYAACQRFTAKKAPATSRICFFGESAAAGYLYAPALTPAQVLEAQLNSFGRQGGFEVIDLSRTNERIDTLIETVESSLQLDPDLFVVYAGNNWTLLETPEISPYAASVDQRLEFAAALREGGVLGPIERAARLVLERGAGALAKLNQLARARSIPVILIVPEVNVLDWESRQPALWLPGNRTAEWHRLRKTASQHLSGSDWSRAAKTAGEMSEHDGFTCPTSQRILARALLGMGDRSRALRACRAEVDSNQYANLCFLGAPQATPMVQELLARSAQRFGFHVVDLRRIFADHSVGSLPGRDLFLDYCHLTVPGMRVAMAAVAAEGLGILGRYSTPPRWQDLVAELPESAVAPGPDAAAKLGAAVHGAHRLAAVGLKTPILEYWCHEALDSSSEAVRAMLDLLKVRSPLLPETLNAAQRANFQSPCKLTPQHGWRYDFIDADLTLSILNVLKARVPDAYDQALQCVIDRHAVSKGKVNLVHPPFYLWEPLERFYPEAMAPGTRPRRGTLRSPWPSSSFCLVTEAAGGVEVSLCARLPGIEGLEDRRPGKVVVQINGRMLQTLPLDSSWSRHTLRIRPHHLRLGLNKLTLHWPMPHWSGEAALEAAVSRLERGLEADLHPVFGEVFDLIAEPNSPAPKSGA